MSCSWIPRSQQTTWGLGQSGEGSWHPWHMSCSPTCMAECFSLLVLHRWWEAAVLSRGQERPCPAHSQLTGREQARQTLASVSLPPSSALAPSGWQHVVAWLGPWGRAGAALRSPSAQRQPALIAGTATLGHVPAGEFWFLTGGCWGGLGGIYAQLLQIWPRAYGGRSQGLSCTLWLSAQLFVSQRGRGAAACHSCCMAAALTHGVFPS